MPLLVGKEQATAFVSEISNERTREAVRLLLDGIAEFHGLYPSILQSPFDLVFFAQILEDWVALVETTLTGKMEDEWYDDDVIPSTRQIADQASDVNEKGVRKRQAYNYVATRDSRLIQLCLLVLITYVDIRQTPGARLVGDQNLIGFLRPAFPFDYLFMVMAVDHALQPGRPPQLLFENSAEADTSGTFS